MSDSTIEQIATDIVRGGWPASLDKKPTTSHRHAIDYVEAVINQDVSAVDDIQTLGGC